MNRIVKIPTPQVLRWIRSASRQREAVKFRMAAGVSYSESVRTYLLAECRPELLVSATITVGARVDHANVIEDGLSINLDFESRVSANIVEAGKVFDCSVVFAGTGICEAAGIADRAERDLSRLIGALGEVSAARLAAATVCIVGCGGLGAAVAVMLAGGAVNRLILVDDDILDLSNLHRMPCGYRTEDIGKRKADVLGALLSKGFGSRIVAIPERFASVSLMLALRNVDLLIVATDNVSSRREVGLFASEYLIPALSLGSGVFGENRLTGYEVALALPGDGCLNCVADLPETDDQFAFGEGRRGSLSSINSICAGFAMKVIEDLASGRLDSSRAWRYMWESGLNPIEGSRGRGHCACQDRTGIGDLGLYA